MLAKLNIYINSIIQKFKMDLKISRNKLEKLFKQQKKEKKKKPASIMLTFQLLIKLALKTEEIV